MKIRLCLGVITAFGGMFACSVVSQDLGSNDGRRDASSDAPQLPLDDSGTGSNGDGQSSDGSRADGADGNPPDDGQLRWQDTGKSYSILRAVSGTSPTDVWMVGGGLGNLAVIEHFDGSRWLDFSLSGITSFNGLWVRSTVDAVTVGTAGRIYRWNGSAWRPFLVDINTTKDLYGVWGASANDIWVAGGTISTGAGTSDVFHWNGSAWSTRSRASSWPSTCVWGSGPNDVWVGGFDMIEHWDGRAWSTSAKDLQTTVYSIWGTASNDIWAVGNFGFLSHWDGSKWTRSAIGESINFNGVWGAASNDVYAVGSSDTIAHYDGTRWTLKKNTTDNEPNAVWGGSPNDVWVVGYGNVFRGTR